MNPGFRLSFLVVVVTIGLTFGVGSVGAQKAGNEDRKFTTGSDIHPSPTVVGGYVGAETVFIRKTKFRA